MNIRRYLIPILLISITVIWAGTPQRDNIVKGTIFVTGNEPFTKLAIRTDSSKVYLLKGRKDTEKLLRRNQGKIVRITYHIKKKALFGEEITIYRYRFVNK